MSDEQEYVYTHAMPDGKVFYVGMGSIKRTTDFFNRTAAHKSVVKQVGRENVLVEKFVCEPGTAWAKELEMMLFHVTAGSPLVNAVYDSGPPKPRQAKERSVPNKTNAERQAKLKAKRVSDGLVRVSLWMHPDDVQAIRAMIEAARVWRAANVPHVASCGCRACDVKRNQGIFPMGGI